MPSYRVHLPVGQVLPGHDPSEVLETLEAAISSHFVVENKDVEVVRGVGRCVVRFLVPATSREDEDRRARHAAADGAQAVREVATCGQPVVTRRFGNRFLPIV